MENTQLNKRFKVYPKSFNLIECPHCKHKQFVKRSGLQLVSKNTHQCLVCRFQIDFNHCEIFDSILEHELQKTIGDRYYLLELSNYSSVRKDDLVILVGSYEDCLSKFVLAKHLILDQQSFFSI